MKSIETMRETAIRRVMRTVARRRRSGDMVRDADGRLPIVVALPDDSVESVEAKRLRAGGTANLFIAYPDKLVMLEMMGSDEKVEAADVHPSSTIDMVVAWIRQTPEQCGSIRIGVSVAQDVRELEYSL